MKPVIAVVSPGMMGSGVGQRLAENNLEVRTSTVGRSPETVQRARDAGMIPSSDEQLAECDVILSILPPGDALNLAKRLAPSIGAAGSKPIYADCNAVSPATVRHIASALDNTGTRFVDGGIIGGPPQPGSRGPRVYLSGEHAAHLAQLVDCGLDLRVQDGPIGAASAMKLSYAGITKGFTALGAAMMLASTRAGTSEALIAELADSQPELLERLARQTPGMYSKAHRFVAEMEELADFTSEDPAAQRFFEGAAMLYDRLARDLEGEKSETGALTAFVEAAARHSR